jgi:PAB1-binding protein PBP1
MVQQKKGQNATEIRNGAGTEANMSFQRSQIADARPLANNNGKPNDRAYNGMAGSQSWASDKIRVANITSSPTGNTPQPSGNKFRTDTAISSTAPYQERKLQKWVPEPDSTFDGDGGLEAPSGGRGEVWDQFKVAELRGLKSDYDENIYTTAINRDDPNYYKRKQLADRKAREIETSAPMTSHVAEERQADYKQGTVDEGGDEEEK